MLNIHTKSHTIRSRPTLKLVERFGNGSVRKLYERSIYEQSFTSELSIEKYQAKPAKMSYLIIIMFTCKHNCVFRRDWEPSRIPEGTLKCLRRKGRKVKEYVYECICPSIPKFSWLHCYVKCCSKRTSRLDEGEKCQPNQGICYRDITLINLVNCKRIKKGTYIIDCIQLNTWRLNSVNESNIIKRQLFYPLRWSY